MYLLYATNIHQGYRPRCEKADSRQHGEEQVQDRGKKKKQTGKKNELFVGALPGTL